MILFKNSWPKRMVGKVQVSGRTVTFSKTRIEFLLKFSLFWGYEYAILIYNLLYIPVCPLSSIQPTIIIISSVTNTPQNIRIDKLDPLSWATIRTNNLDINFLRSKQKISPNGESQIIRNYPQKQYPRCWWSSFQEGNH